MSDTDTTIKTFDSSNPENVLDMCCGGKKCPVVSLDGNEMHVTDNGQSVTFTREQWQSLTAWAQARGF